MKDRYNAILHILENSERPVTGDEFSSQLNISSRTVRKDIKDLNDNYLIGAHISSNTREGYKLVGKLAGIKQRQYNDFKERAFYIVKALLSESKWATYEQLSESLYFSTQTIRTDIQRISQIINSQKRDLSIVAVPFHGVGLEGGELDKRLLLASFVEDYMVTMEEVNTELLDYFDNWISKIELDTLSTIVVKTLESCTCGVPINKVSRVLTYLIIALYRVRQGFEITNEVRNENHPAAYKEFQLALDITQKIQEKLGANISRCENSIFTLSLISQRIIADRCENEPRFSEKLDYEIKDSLINLGKQYGFKFIEDQQLVTGLLFHLTRVLYPLRYNFSLENPYISKIKMEYLLAYDISVMLAHHLENELNFVIPENEIGYIALHFAAYIERQKEKKIKIALVNNGGIGTSTILKQKIRTCFPYIELKECSPTMLDEIEEDVSLIISGTDIESKGNIPICVSGFPDDNDLEKIEFAIYNVFFLRTLNEERFLVLNENSKCDFLLKLVKTMKIEPLLANILKREEMSATDVGNGVAMPHPVEQTDNYETKIYIAINKTPILWGIGKVQLVFLIIPSKEDREDHFKIFKRINQLVKSSDTIKKLIQTEDFHSFLKLLNSN